MFGRRLMVCPWCKRAVGEFKGQICTFSCSRCKIIIILDKESGAVKVEKDKQENRVASSGRRFL